MAALFRVPGHSMLLATWPTPGSAAAQSDQSSSTRRATLNGVETGAVDIVSSGRGSAPIVPHHAPSLRDPHPELPRRTRSIH